MNIFLGATLLIAVGLILVSSVQGENANPSTGINFPFTKWCGFGNNGQNYNDLGLFKNTDKCCRDHLHCGEILEPFSSLHSLFNPSIIRKFTCKCELQLRNCLLRVKDMPSNIVGQAYFSGMRQCFANDHPIVECLEYQDGIFGKRCIKYKFDTSQRQKWQFFDLPYFTI